VTATWVALLLVLVAFAASQARLPQAPPTGMVAAFVDVNGNDIDDSCEDPATVEAEADPDAEQAAAEAVDLDGDGTISVSEAAQSDRIGGKNCNHGGYVSTVAHGTDDCDEAETPEVPEATTDEDEADDGSPEDSDHAAIETSPGTAVAGDCAEDEPEADETEEADDAAKDAARAACEAAQAAGTPLVLAPMTHVELAQSDVVGGKNCNHGGAVSEANKAAKAERDAAKLAAREARQAAHAAKSHGKHGKHGGQN
jgi:hypothetical protein